jgi:hypothetical protein
MSAELRAGVAALSRGESLAATARRLLADAVADENEFGARSAANDAGFQAWAAGPAGRASAADLIEWLTAEDDRLRAEIDDPEVHAGPGAVGLQQSLVMVLAHISNEFVHADER